MDSVTLDKGFGNCSNDVEMDWISTKFESLTDIKELYIQNSSDTRFILGIMEHDVGSILILWGGQRISLILHVSGQKTDFSSHINCVGSVSFGGSIMFVLQCFIQSELVLGAYYCFGGNVSCFSFVMIERS